MTTPRLTPQSRPLDALLRRKTVEILDDGVVTRDEVRALSTLARTSRGDARPAREVLAPFVAEHAERFEDAAALREARQLLDQAPLPMPRPNNALFEVRARPDEHCVRSQELYLKGEGSLRGDTGIRTYSRGWLQLNQSVLQAEHGSRPPRSSVLTTAERQAMSARTPAQRLDHVARLVRGGPVGMSSFEDLSRSRAFANPDEPDFAGVCYAWSWAALDARLSALVDVEGPEGKRGLWIAGEWLSRADLGNWLMALLAGLSQGAGEVMWYSPEAEDLLKAALGYLMEGGIGFRADIGPALESPNEIWFQPFVGADVTVARVPEPAIRAILAVARAQVKTPYGATVPGVEGTDVKLVRVTGRYGDEQGDDHEGEPATKTMEWSAYAVVDGQGKMLKAYLASDPRIADVPELPARESRPVPRELFAADHELVDGVLLGTPAPEVEGSVFGPHFELFVGTVLARGVPGVLREAFEREPILQRPGKIAAADAAALAARYPTLAHAYSPEQWARCFGARGLDAAQFGAA